MNHKRPPLPAIFLVILVLGFSIYFILTQSAEDKNGAVTASGTIEAIEINVAPELAGKVKDVLAVEGQSVKAGDPLLSLDDSLLAAQRDVALSAVNSARNGLLTAQSAHDLAQAQYDGALIAARAQEGSQRLTDWSNRTPIQFEQPMWYFSRDEQIAATRYELDVAIQALETSQATLEGVVQDLKNADYVAAETRLSNARISYLVAKAVYSHALATGGKVSPEDIDIKLPRFIPAYQTKISIAKKMSGESDVITAADEALNAAEAELDEAQNVFDDLITGDGADQVLEARAAVTVAQERYEVALDTLSRLQTGENSPQVRIASMVLEQGKSAVQQAESAIQQAEASLALIDAQAAKLTVYAPMDGVILTRNIEPGEFVQPGMAAFALADLNNITITVYVPEDRYGQISLGQQAQVRVDSFPGETFTAEVIHIADQAEFTPRNVQTVESRSSTVYAIKLKVTNSEGKLKIGMPADIEFK